MGLLKTLLLGGTLAGCTSEVGQAPGFEGAVVNDQPLIIDDSNLWLDPNISVCWTSLAAATATQRLWVQQAVEREIQSISDIRFTGWDKLCSSNPAEVAIRVGNYWPESEYGERAASSQHSMSLNFFSTPHAGFPGCENDIRTPVTGDTGREWVSERHRCIDVIAAHEFAHVLGIGHEQDRSDKPATCTEPSDPGTTAWNEYGYWDWSSISNYCNPVWDNDGRLSVLDVAGIQEYYGAPTNDRLWISLGNLRDYSGTAPTADLMTFETRMPSVATGYQPLPGDFNADGIDDIFWYRPGTLSDSIWFFDSEGGHTSLSKTIGGTYEPLVGDFNGDGRSDIFWYGAGNVLDAIWFFNTDGTHTVRNETVSGTYTAFTGDFNGDDRTDIFWYRPGVASESIWFFNADKTHSERSEDVSATYQPFAGDFDGDGNHDIFWYRPGADSDSVWYFASNKTHTSASVNITGTYAPTAGDYDGDGRADILWTRSGSDSIWMGTATRGTFVSTSTRYDGSGVAVSGDFNGDLLDDVFFYE
jgi:hypothetical protein